MSERCPICGREPLTTTRPRIERDVGIESLYRHRVGGRTYLHEIEFSRAAFVAASEVTHE